MEFCIDTLVGIKANLTLTDFQNHTAEDYARERGHQDWCLKVTNLTSEKLKSMDTRPRGQHHMP